MKKGKAAGSNESVEQEILRITGEDPRDKKESVEDYAKRLAEALDEVTDNTNGKAKVDWESLSKGVQGWFTDVAEASKSNKPYPSLPTIGKSAATNDGDDGDGADDERGDDGDEDGDADTDEDDTDDDADDDQEQEKEVKTTKRAAKKRAAKSENEPKQKRAKKEKVTKQEPEQEQEQEQEDTSQASEATSDEPKARKAKKATKTRAKKATASKPAKAAKKTGKKPRTPKESKVRQPKEKKPRRVSDSAKLYAIASQNLGVDYETFAAKAKKAGVAVAEIQVKTVYRNTQYVARCFREAGVMK